MSKKRILFWATSLIPVAATVGSLASCSCNDANQGEYLIEPSTDKREFKLERVRYEDLSQYGEYLFSIDGFKLKNGTSKGKWHISAKLVVGDDVISLSLKEKMLRRDGKLSFTLYSEEWDELIAISGSDTPYEIKDLSVKHNGKELIRDGSGYTTLIQTTLVGPNAYSEDQFTGNLSDITPTVQMNIPTGDNTDSSFILCNTNNDFDVEDIAVEAAPIDSRFPGTFSNWKLNVCDTPYHTYYLTTTCTWTEVYYSDSIFTNLAFRVTNKNDSSIVYYENDGIWDENEFVFLLVWAGD